MRFLLLLFLILSNTFAIIDIASIDFGDKKEGFSGSVYGSFQTKRGNTNKDEAEYGGRIEYDSNGSVTWVQGSVEHDEVLGITTDDNAFLHLRHIHRLGTPSWAMEVYAQLKQDKFKNLNNRTLLGTGLRYKAFDSKPYGKLFFGLSAMDEKITYNQVDSDEHNSRLSSYFSYAVDINDVFELNYLGYCQVKFDDSSDYLTSSMAEMTIHLTKVFDLSYVMEFDYDARPPLNIQNTDTRQKLAFIYRFGSDDPLSAYAQNLLYKETLPDKRGVYIPPKEYLVTATTTDTSFTGTWVAEDENFIVLDNGTGRHTQDKGIYNDKFNWKIVSDNKTKKTKQIRMEYIDEEGRVQGVEHYLWNEDTLVGLIGEKIKIFKR